MWQCLKDLKKKLFSLLTIVLVEQSCRPVRYKEVIFYVIYLNIFLLKYNVLTLFALYALCYLCTLYALHALNCLCALYALFALFALHYLDALYALNTLYTLYYLFYLENIYLKPIRYLKSWWFICSLCSIYSSHYIHSIHSIHYILHIHSKKRSRARAPIGGQYGISKISLRTEMFNFFKYPKLPDEL